MDKNKKGLHKKNKKAPGLKKRMALLEKAFIRRRNRIINTLFMRVFVIEQGVGIKINPILFSVSHQYQKERLT